MDRIIDYAYSIWNHMTAWYDRQIVDEFVQCIPLKPGTIIVAVIGIIYGFIGLYLFMSVCVHFGHWKDIYTDRFDLLMYLFFIFMSMIIVFVASIILIVGVIGDFEILFYIYTWCIISHLGIIWLMTVVMFFYCLFEDKCFQGHGMGHAVVASIINAFYTLVWIYVILSVNSYRLSMWDY